MEKAKRIVKNALLIFAFVSIGYALGKRSGGERLKTDHVKAAGSGDVVRVYYMHGTFRCATCNAIESMTEALLKKKFAEELRTAQVEFKDVNFQRDEALAKRFGVASSCVVVAKEENGEIQSFKRLDEVWTWKDDPATFDARVGQVVRNYLSTP